MDAKGGEITQSGRCSRVVAKGGALCEEEHLGMLECLTEQRDVGSEGVVERLEPDEIDYKLGWAKCELRFGQLAKGQGDRERQGVVMEVAWQGSKSHDNAVGCQLVMVVY
jgi:hypothetical protein